MKKPLDESQLAAVRASKPRHLPTVLSKAEAPVVIENLKGANKLIEQIMYGSGTSVVETLCVRVKDLDFANCQIIVRDVKWEKDRLALIPETIIPALEVHLPLVKGMEEKDLAEGYG